MCPEVVSTVVKDAKLPWYKHFIIFWDDKGKSERGPDGKWRVTFTDGTTVNACKDHEKFCNKIVNGQED